MAMKEKMRALVCRRLGDATEPFSETSALAVDREQPVPVVSSPRHVRVKVKAASVNFANVLNVAGTYQERPPLPFIPGSDFSGIVLQIGSQVTSLKVGDVVCGFTLTGAYAEEVVVEDANLFVVPPQCDIIAAAGVPVAFGTSHFGLVHRVGLHSGQVLLVLGAAGGVGISAVQIGKICGATVIAVARGKEKAQLLQSLGADMIVDPSEGNMVKDVSAFLKARGLKGVDVLYDPVGGEIFKNSLKLLNWGAQILIVGFASGDIPSLRANILLVKNWTVHGLYWTTYVKHQTQSIRDSMEEILSWLSKGIMNIHVSHKFSLEEAYSAFSTIVDRKVLGKVMVVIDEDVTPPLQESISRL